MDDKSRRIYFLRLLSSLGFPRLHLWNGVRQVDGWVSYPRRGYHNAMQERWTLAVAAVCFGIGAVTIWTAALMPQFFPIWTGRGNQHEIVRRHATLWRMNAALFTTSAVAVLIGCALVFTSKTGPFAVPSLLVLTVATALWVTNNALRMSAVVEVATDGAPTSHGWLALAEAWTTALWFIASVLVLLAFAGLGVTTLTSAVLGAWIGWVMIASAVLSLGFLVLLRDLPPVVAYLPVLPLAVASGMAAVQT